MSDPVIHLERQEHDGGADTWCGITLGLAEVHIEGVIEKDPAAATCLDCLEAAREYGQAAFKRREQLRRGLAPP